MVAVELALASCEPETALEKVREVVRWRVANQPGGLNAGSVFTNPPGDSAGRLIDAAGLKGLREGSASVSEKHANFFQADKHGSADDVKALIDRVRAAVAEKDGIVLVPELRMVGFPDTPLPMVKASTSTGGSVSRPFPKATASSGSSGSPGYGSSGSSGSPRAPEPAGSGLSGDPSTSSKGRESGAAAR